MPWRLYRVRVIARPTLRLLLVLWPAAAGSPRLARHGFPHCEFAMAPHAVRLGFSWEWVMRSWSIPGPFEQAIRAPEAGKHCQGHRAGEY